MRMTFVLILVCFAIPVFFNSSVVVEDPPDRKKKKDSIVMADTINIQIQEQRSINIEDLDKLNELFDSLNLQQDSIIKKK